MQQLKDASKEAWERVSKLDLNTWCRAFFSEHPTCDVLVNNWCEVMCPNYGKVVVDLRAQTCACTKKLRSTGTTLRCGSCANQGHNRNTCHKYVQDARGPRDSTASSTQEAAGSSVPQPSGVPLHSRSNYKTQNAKK
ncbi:hypothetical protein TIFTF001_037842 [Ficus carica]|uniref:Uncharacterized protein n=1 Tax=Ficus carica TaxID=3494 RepID=A0AA88E6Z2_FICCA|nr:hypothetical protein TIFTF001_037842 [Ficus carica]